MPAKTDIEVDLTGISGNIFAIGSRVRNALKLNGRGDLAADFTKELRATKTYAEALALVEEYVVVA